MLHSDKTSRTQNLSQTTLLARHLISFVNSSLEADAALSLDAAVRSASAERHAHFERLGLKSLHHICSGRGLGKSKRRGAMVAGPRAESVEDGASADDGEAPTESGPVE